MTQPEEDSGNAGFIIVYSAFSFSGFLIGLLVGWLVWA